MAAVLSAPVALEQAVERASFHDRIGTFPVEVSLTRNGVSTLDTGILGKVYWDRTGAGGFGASVVSTGPPLADGTLASYVSADFLRRNSQFIDDPGALAGAYGAELRRQVVGAWLRYELIGGLAGGLLLLVVFRGTAPPVPRRVVRRRHRTAVRAGYLLAGTLVSGLAAFVLYDQWPGSDPPGPSYVMPELPELSFSSRQTLEVARQVRPFVEKNASRIEARTQDYVDAASAAIDRELPRHADALRARGEERVVIAEADPQGSFVATRVRRQLYRELEELLGEDTIALRTISGDITSNGTVAERDFVRQEAGAAPGIPTVAVKGDHDTDATVAQMRDHDLAVPDMEVLDVGGLKVAGAADPTFKALFGGLVENPSGVSEEEVGRELRARVDPEEAVVVLLHQPRAALGYLGIDTIARLAAARGHETAPYDDGIPDLPPGIVNIGHLHDPGGPWVVWNTDGDQVTWTVVNQLGTSGGVEETPTFNRFSTPFSVPLKAVTVQLQYVEEESGLQTGYASVAIAPDGSVTVTDRVDLGLAAPAASEGARSTPSARSSRARGDAGW